jgi:alkanesulfonate monooxygenase SsuD/methylene tetrahydromethanopterin reductase-like flavin-dependent oxidoreductase (luciferase family)
MTSPTDRLRFGILVTPIYGADTPPERQLREHRELVQSAARLGFDLIVAGQHFLGTELRYYQPVPYLSYLSTVVPDMTVVTGIMLLSMANPVDMAEQIATLDVVTGGKCVFGVGLGYSGREFAAFGVDPKDKVARFEQGLELIKALWSGERVDHTSDFWTVQDVMPSVLPVQRPHPPIWIGGQSAPAIRRAARFGDAWYAPPFPSHTGLAELREVFLKERARWGLGGDGVFPVRREMLIADTREQALAQAIERSELRYRTYQKWGLGGANTTLAAAAGRGSAQDIEDHFFLGTADDCAQQLAELRETVGMTHFIYKAHWQGLPHEEAMAQLERFGTGVIPRFR